MVREVCEAVRKAIYGSKRLAEVKAKEESADDEGEAEEEEEETIGANERVGIVTVAETVGFWNLSVSHLAVPSSLHVFLCEELTPPALQCPRRPDGSERLGRHVCTLERWLLGGSSTV